MLPSPPAPVKTKDAPAPPALFPPPARLQTSRARFPFSGGTRVSDAPFVVRLSWGLSRWGRDLVRLRHQYTGPPPPVKGVQSCPTGPSNLASPLQRLRQRMGIGVFQIAARRQP